MKLYFLLHIFALSTTFLFSQKRNIVIKVSEQKLYLFESKKIIKTYDISTSKYGVGNEKNSNKTPLGKHIVDRKFGDTAKIGTVFKSREPKNYTQEIYTKKPKNYKEKDIIITRIIWLRGIEKGRNLGGNVDSYSRYIYIHGTHEEWEIGIPASKGCIRMRNKDIIELYNLIKIASLVNIKM